MNIKYLLVTLILVLVILGGTVYGLTSHRIGMSQTLTEAQALESIFIKYPALKAYQTTSLPPSTIQTKEAVDGWYIGFIQSGSGLPGILHAECYKVTHIQDVSVVGEYNRDPNTSTGAIVTSIDVQTCTPFTLSATGTASSTVKSTPTKTPASEPIHTGGKKGESNTQATCYIGGCSGQICSDTPNTLSTCEYREEYICYKQATCERQLNGQCGWTNTLALQACLASH